MTDTDLQAEVARLVRTIDALRANERCLIDALFEATQSRSAPQENATSRDWTATDQAAAEHAPFRMMLRTVDGHSNTAMAQLSPATELDAASRAFEVSEHYFCGESPADRIANWRVWIHAWRARANQAAGSSATQRHRFIDEIDAARLGEAFIKAKVAELGHDAKEVLHSDIDTSAQMPRVKWVALFDTWDNLRAAYILTRDLANYTQVTLVAPPTPERPRY